MQIKPVHRGALGEGQSFSDEATYSLPEGVVPALHMISLASVFSYHLVLTSCDDFGVSFPKIAVRTAPSVCWRYELP